MLDVLYLLLCNDIITEQERQPLPCLVLLFGWNVQVGGGGEKSSNVIRSDGSFSVEPLGYVQGREGERADISG